MTRFAWVLPLIFAVSACGSDADEPKAKPESSVSVDPNVANCEDVLDVFQDIKSTFAGYDVDNNMFDPSVAEELRDEATALFALEGKASGPAAVAIHNEAAALVDLSIAMQSADVTAFADASQEANRSLAALRGACSF